MGYLTMTAAHTHAAVRSDGPYPFFGPVATRAEDECRAAHGGCVYIESCACGDERRVAHNQERREYGPWVEGREARKAREERIETARLAGLRAAASARLRAQGIQIQFEIHGGVRSVRDLHVTLDGVGQWHGVAAIKASLAGMSAEQRATWSDVLIAGGVAS
mgnify:CR=1 FL=1